MLILIARALGVLTFSLWVGAAVAAPADASVPNFDIRAACRQLSMVPEALTVETGQSDAIQHCMQAEQEARTQLTKEWSQFSTADRRLCVGESKSGGVAPVYSELETCLQMTRESRQLSDQQTGENGGPGRAAAPSERPPGQTAQNQK